MISFSIFFDFNIRAENSRKSISFHFEKINNPFLSLTSEYVSQESRTRTKPTDCFFKSQFELENPEQFKFLSGFIIQWCDLMIYSSFYQVFNQFWTVRCVVKYSKITRYYHGHCKMNFSCTVSPIFGNLLKFWTFEIVHT